VTAGALAQLNAESGVVGPRGLLREQLREETAERPAEMIVQVPALGDYFLWRPER